MKQHPPFEGIVRIAGWDSQPLEEMFSKTFISVPEFQALWQLLCSAVCCLLFVTPQFQLPVGFLHSVVFSEK